MQLAQLINSCPSEAADTEISDLAYDSRKVTPGTLFFCVSGFERDGHDFAAQAVENGAVGLVVERPLGLGVPEVVVPSTREAMAPLAARFFGDPTSRLAVVGVTGTNGKTTSAYLIRSLLEAADRQCALLGTVESVIGGERHEAIRTTAEAIDLQRDFAAMLAAGDRACAMEASSHALELGRCDATHFAVALFTNLTQDHLDFHGTMEEYFESKRRLFELGPNVSVVNIDDEYGRRLAADFPVTTFALERDADYRATAIESDATGSRFVVQAPDTELAIESPLPGRFNVYNVLGALVMARTLGVADDVAVSSLATAGRVPGRFEPVREGQDFTVIVDYAHTPDSLENVLRAAREITTGKLICVFGCGGDRDRGKRPRMGQIAEQLADSVIVTSDNPRSEVPTEILEEIVAGMSAPPVVEIEDRRVAIEQAIVQAGSGDLVLIAGKGHEQGQEFAGGEKLPFDDVSVARELLQARVGA